MQRFSRLEAHLHSSPYGGAHLAEHPLRLAKDRKVHDAICRKAVAGGHWSSQGVR